jgi:hypothetical protein
MAWRNSVTGCGGARRARDIGVSDHNIPIAHGRDALPSRFAVARQIPHAAGFSLEIPVCGHVWRRRQTSILCGIRCVFPATRHLNSQQA